MRTKGRQHQIEISDDNKGVVMIRIEDPLLPIVVVSFQIQS
jgi:hypothetical protein